MSETYNLLPALLLSPDSKAVAIADNKTVIVSQYSWLWLTWWNIAIVTSAGECSMRYCRSLSVLEKRALKHGIGGKEWQPIGGQV